MRKTTGFLITILAAAGPMLAADLVVDSYSLCPGPHVPIRLGCVAEKPVQWAEWRDEASTKNPRLYAGLSFEKLATLEVRAPNFDDLGSWDPFVLAARQRAGKAGANLLVQENAVRNKTTQRVSRVTYTAYLVTHDRAIVPGPLLKKLLAPVPSNDGFSTEVREGMNRCVVLRSSAAAPSPPGPSAPGERKTEEPHGDQ